MTAAESDSYGQRKLLARLMRLVAVNAFMAWASGRGHPGRYYSQTAHRSSEEQLQPGDLVCEWSTLWSWVGDDETQRQAYPEIGILLRVVWEPVEGSDECEKVWYIRPLDGHRDEVRWTNASFFRVLTSLGGLGEE